MGQLPGGFCQGGGEIGTSETGALPNWRKLLNLRDDRGEGVGREAKLRFSPR